MGCGCSYDRREELRYFHSSYILGSKLGSGAHAQVRLAYRIDTLQEVAVKIVVLRKTKNGRVDRGLVRACKNEIALASRVGSHPHCVQLFESLRENHLYYLVMERCQSSLMEMMKTNFSLIQDDLQRVLREMLTGIAHCHSLRVVHRDIKPENFMLGGPKGKTLKLCDFGMAEALPAGEYLKGICGTAPYMAPEMLREEAYDERVDVWSYGTVAYLMLFGHFPYEPEVIDNEAFKAVIRAGEPEPFFPLDKRGAFAQVLLEREKGQRYRAHEVLQLNFLDPQASGQLRWEAEVERAAFAVTAVEQNVCEVANPIVQHSLDELLERLQNKHIKFHTRHPVSIPTMESEASSSPAFYHFSEGEGSYARADDEVSPTERSPRRGSTHNGVVRVVPEQLKDSVLSHRSTIDTTASFDDIRPSWEEVANHKTYKFDSLPLDDISPSWKDIASRNAYGIDSPPFDDISPSWKDIANRNVYGFDSPTVSPTKIA
eukprot:TRINITY_DN18614_c1_g1_i1.p1 TRINITY_DN18614_c1_g1~~TRINITY_DN18614_c1_g1_i1.p1  ORF type:complete len:497 (+),score=38.13 TRINITY_DN18614_c1_g1_i1:33-1493(+)